MIFVRFSSPLSLVRFQHRSSFFLRSLSGFPRHFPWSVTSAHACRGFLNSLVSFLHYNILDVWYSSLFYLKRYQHSFSPLFWSMPGLLHHHVGSASSLDSVVSPNPVCMISCSLCEEDSGGLCPLFFLRFYFNRYQYWFSGILWSLQFSSPSCLIRYRLRLSGFPRIRYQLSCFGLQEAQLVFTRKLHI